MVMPNGCGKVEPKIMPVHAQIDMGLRRGKSAFIEIARSLGYTVLKASDHPMPQEFPGREPDLIFIDEARHIGESQDNV